MDDQEDHEWIEMSNMEAVPLIPQEDVHPQEQDRLVTFPLQEDPSPPPDPRRHTDAYSVLAYRCFGKDQLLNVVGIFFVLVIIIVIVFISAYNTKA